MGCSLPRRCNLPGDGAAPDTLTGSEGANLSQADVAPGELRLSRTVRHTDHGGEGIVDDPVGVSIVRNQSGDADGRLTDNASSSIPVKTNHTILLPREAPAMEPIAIYALTVVALFLKMIAVAVVQGYYRVSRGVFAKPEDADTWGDGTVADADLPIVDRGQRTLRNDVENIPIFLFLGWVYVALEAWPTGAWIYFGAFVLSRFVHTYAYLRPTQPLRNRAYLLGVLAGLFVAGHVIYEIVTTAV